MSRARQSSSFDREVRAIRALLVLHSKHAPSLSDAGFLLLHERMREQHDDRYSRLGDPAEVEAAVEETEAELA